jgi:hypothetical protein
MTLLAVVAVACGSASGPLTATVPPIVAPSSSAAAGASGGPGDQPSGSAQPRRWATNAVSAMIALGAIDEEIRRAGIDLQGAVQAEDLKKMWGAADGLAKLIDSQLSNIDSLDQEPATQAIAKIYHASFPEISSGAKQLRDAITAGNSDGIVTGTQKLLDGLNAYAPARPLLEDLVQEALTQKRLYLE